MYGSTMLYTTEARELETRERFPSPEACRVVIPRDVAIRSVLGAIKSNDISGDYIPARDSRAGFAPLNLVNDAKFVVLVYDLQRAEVVQKGDDQCELHACCNKLWRSKCQLRENSSAKG
ncbi:unnamed protein product [Lasius platythorax]|uniref:Uncharacterized protein n=1 Tax=Lasius platythorax TaxID=488582 RepID=A0AAV2PBD8_9HYME